MLRKRGMKLLQCCKSVINRCFCIFTAESCNPCSDTPTPQASCARGCRWQVTLPVGRVGQHQRAGRSLPCHVPHFPGDARKASSCV
eukprot:278483-Chlamydomonas_euryale.AAC.1